MVNDNLVGLGIYYRDSLDNIDLVHIAVDEKYSSTGKYADKLLVLQIINELKKIALTYKDICLDIRGTGLMWGIELEPLMAANIYEELKNKQICFKLWDLFCRSNIMIIF